MRETPNPYESSLAPATPESANTSPRSQLVPVAVALLVPSILHIAGGLFFFVYVYSIVSSSDADPDQSQALIVYCMYYGVSMLYSLLLATGAFTMIRRGSYLWAITVCILAIIPFFGPCYILAVPAGIWGIIVLRRADVRRSFTKP